MVEQDAAVVRGGRSGSLRRNSLFSAAEVVINGIGLFLIYRHVAAVLGVSMVGVWGLVLSTTAFGRAADLGISGGLSRFVARSLAEGDPSKAAAYIRTGTVFIATLMGALALALWWPLYLGLDVALDGDELQAARSVLPWAIVSVWLLVLKSVLDSCLIGAHRADLRSIAGVAGMTMQVVTSLILVAPFGLQGLAWSQAGQFALAIGLEIVFLLRISAFRHVGLLTGSWFSRPLFKEMLGFGATLQVGTIGTLLFEPLTKTALGAVAGTHVLGIFEMAYRMTYQAKNVATMALQPTIPVLTEAATSAEQDVRAVFQGVSRTAAWMTAGLMIGLTIVSPLLSWLLLQEVNAGFVLVTAIMAVAWATAILAAPAYYLGIADGTVWPYVVGEYCTAIVAPLAIIGFGLAGGSAWWTIVGILVAKSLGSLVLAYFIRPAPPRTSSIVFDMRATTSLALVSAVSLVAVILAAQRL